MSSKNAENLNLSEIKATIMKISSSISNQETDAKNICIELNSITKQLHQLFTSDDFSNLDGEGRKYVNSLWVRTKKLDECVDQLAEVLASIDKTMSEMPKDFCIQSIESTPGISIELDNPEPIKQEEENATKDILSPQNENPVQSSPTISPQSKKIVTVLPQGRGMREIRTSNGFIESFFKACDATSTNFRTLVFENIRCRLTKTYVNDPALDSRLQGVYANIFIKDYLLSFSASFHGSPHKLKLAKLTLMNLYETRKRGKPIVFPTVKESNKEISFPSTSRKAPRQKTMTPKPPKKDIPQKTLVPKPSKKTPSPKLVSPTKPTKDPTPVSKKIPPNPVQPKLKPDTVSPKRAPKISPKPATHQQPTMFKANLIPDAPQSTTLNQKFLNEVDLNGTYHDSYHPKFYDFFQNKLRATGSVYNTSINNAIDEFLTLFYHLYQELIVLADQKIIYRSELNFFENTFLLLLKKKGRTYEEVRTELSKYDYSRFKFRITPCFKRR